MLTFALHFHVTKPCISIKVTQEWWYMPGIPDPRLKQEEGCYEFKASPDYTGQLCLSLKPQNRSHHSQLAKPFEDVVKQI